MIETSLMFCPYISRIRGYTLCLLTDEDGNNTWPEVLQFMLECIQSTEMTLKESALHIFR